MATAELPGEGPLSEEKRGRGSAQVQSYNNLKQQKSHKHKTKKPSLFKTFHFRVLVLFVCVPGALEGHFHGIGSPGTEDGFVLWYF